MVRIGLMFYICSIQNQRQVTIETVKKGRFVLINFDF